MERGKYISVIAFWGAAWGLIEATLGHFLHLINFNTGWLFWFPLAFFFMSEAFRQTNRPVSALYTSSVAAAIKLSNLLSPIRIDKVVNPAVSIVLEGLAVFLAFAAAEESIRVESGSTGTKSLIMKGIGIFRYQLPRAAAASFSWRLLYTAYLFLVPAWMFAISPLRGVIPFLRFFLLEGTVNGLLIYLAAKLAEAVGKIYGKTSVKTAGKAGEGGNGRAYEKAGGEANGKADREADGIAGVLLNLCTKVPVSFGLLAVAVFIQWVV